jgi:predicted MPP superfamily phosphohydrolase
VRILLVADLHYTLKQLDWVASVAGDYDLVVMAGDHLDIASIVAADAQIAVVLEYLSRIAAKTTLVACSGNHDLNARNEYDERAAPWLDAARASGVYVDGSRFGDERDLVTVCPWWDGPLTR